MAIVRGKTLRRGSLLVAAGAGLAAACSGVFSGVPPSGDAGGPGDASVIDASADDVTTLVSVDAADGSTPPCDLDGPFVSIEHVPDLSSSGGEVGLGLTPDGLAAFVVRDSVTDAGYARHLFVARITGRPVSSARMRAIARCCGCASDSPYHARLLALTSTLADTGARTCAAISSPNKSS